MKRTTNINFLSIENQDFSITVYRQKVHENNFDDKYFHTDLLNEEGGFSKYHIVNNFEEGFELYEVNVQNDLWLVSHYIFEKLRDGMAKTLGVRVDERKHSRRKLFFILEAGIYGEKCVWISPYYLKHSKKWGILFEYEYKVKDNTKGQRLTSKEVLIENGTLNSRGGVNTEYYQFKFNLYEKFIQQILPKINSSIDFFKFSTKLESIESLILKAKEYQFLKATSKSSYIGLVNSEPLITPKLPFRVHFIYKTSDREIAVSLLKGLRGELSPSTFGGMQSVFKIPFTNDNISGTSVENFSDEVLSAEISKLKSIGEVVIPIVITNSKNQDEDEQLYYRIKHHFIKSDIACQVVTKELVKNENTLKYSLSNIALQIFAKAGGTPWKMISSSKENNLIIGLGQSYLRDKTDSLKKNIAFSVLTDSTGVFKDLQIVAEGEYINDNYYQQLISNLKNIIEQSEYNKITIHSPFRISKEKIIVPLLNKLTKKIELNVVIVNDKNDFFGFDFTNNGLVPFESTFLNLSNNEYLVWFEGLQFNNPRIAKKIANPLYIKFHFSNLPTELNTAFHKELLLQDCINLSGANWRGFKAKQLPVSIYYCQKISEFITKFQQYDLTEININNLKPWFL